MKRLAKIIYPWGFFTEKILFNHRLARYFSNMGIEFLVKRYESKNYKKYNCIISAGAKIGKNLKLDHPMGIVIGTGVTIGDNVIIYQNVTLGRDSRNNEGYPTIGNNVVIYANAVVVGKIIVSEKSIIGANCVVNHSTAPSSVTTINRGG